MHWLSWFTPAEMFSAVGFLRFYGFWAISHILTQYTWAIGHELRVRAEVRGRKKNRKSPKLDPMPDSIVIWVTVYKESPRLLRSCLQALVEQQGFGGLLEVYVVDDGSYLRELKKYSTTYAPKRGPLRRWWDRLFELRPENYYQRYHYFQEKRDELEAVFREFERVPGFYIERLQENVGKRRAQQAVWVRSKPKKHKLDFTVDSDSVCDPHAVVRLAAKFRNPKVGAATGYVGVGNAKHNLLTRLIAQRYWSAFFVERAAQSFWRSVMCCSGPLAAYRAYVVDEVMERYANQRFLGEYCTFGDDRHLTNLILQLGFEVVLETRATCLTKAPTSLREYRLQQTRWSKSFWREMWWTLNALGSHSKYMTYDLIMQAVLPFMLLGALGVTVYLVVSGGGWTTVALYVGTIVGIGLLRSAYGAIAQRKVSYLLFALYGFVHVGLLIWVKFYALVTPKSLGWGTR